MITLKKLPNKQIGCSKLEDLMKEQVIIANRHADEHRHFQHIPDRNKAIIDFIDKYGFAMREAYCDMCSERPYCGTYQNYLDNKGWRKYFKR